jgi:hypothetical protein
MSKASAKFLADTNKQMAKRSILQEERPSHNLIKVQEGDVAELKKLEKEIEYMEETYKNVSNVKHERRLKSKASESTVAMYENIISLNESKMETSVNNLKLKIENAETQIKVAEETMRLKIEKLENDFKGQQDIWRNKILKMESDIKEAESKGESTIKYHRDQLLKCYEEVPVEVSYPPGYYKKKEEQKRIKSIVEFREKQILLCKMAELEEANSFETKKEEEVRLKREKVREEIYAQERMKKEVEEQERREREETFEARALEKEKQQMQEEMMAERLHKEKHKEKEEEWEEEMTDEQLLQLQITNTKEEIRLLALLISDKQQEMRENPSDVTVYDEIQQHKMKLKELKEYLTNLTSKN